MIALLFGERLRAMGDDQGMVSVWKNEPEAPLWCSPKHDKHHSAVTALAWSSDGQYLASGSADMTVKVWEASTGALLQTYTGHMAEVRALAWSPEGGRIVSSADHECPRVWTPLLPSSDLTKPSSE